MENVWSVLGKKVLRKLFAYFTFIVDLTNDHVVTVRIGDADLVHVDLSPVVGDIRPCLYPLIHRVDDRVASLRLL